MGVGSDDGVSKAEVSDIDTGAKTDVVATGVVNEGIVDMDVSLVSTDGS